MDTSNPKAWSHPEKIGQDENCPKCGYHGGGHVTVFVDGQIGRRCLDCGETWPIEVAREENSSASETTDADLRKIAQDLRDGKIFSDRHCRDLYELRSSFLVIAFMEQAQIKKMEEDQIDFIYEYLDKAGPRSVNGRPVFFSMRLLTKDQTKKMMEFYEQTKPSAVA